MDVTRVDCTTTGREKLENNNITAAPSPGAHTTISPLKSQTQVVYYIMTWL